MEFQRWKATVLLGKFDFDTFDPLVFPPRDEYKDRRVGDKQVEKLRLLVQDVGAMAEGSIWIIDSREHRAKYLQIGKQMFTKDFCHGRSMPYGHELGSMDDIVVWIEKQRREKIAGNHTLESAKQLRAEYPKNPTFQSIVAEIWLIDSKREEDNQKTIFFSAKSNTLSSAGKITEPTERVLYLHKALERKGFYTNYKLDEFGDIEKERGYFKTLIADCVRNWTTDKTQVKNYLAVARTYGAEWNLLFDIMSSSSGSKESKSGTTGPYFHVGSHGVPRTQRIVYFLKFKQKVIDTKELKATFASIRQFRTVQECCLVVANDYKFMGKKTWHSWEDLTENLPSLTTPWIKTYQSTFKMPKKGGKKANLAAARAMPEAFKTALINLFQVRMKFLQDGKPPMVFFFK